MEMEMEMEVKWRRQDTVRPSRPTPSDKRALRLSNNDQIMPRYYISVLFFFLPTDDHAPRHHVGKALKESLSEALAIFYPLAGRFTRRATGGAHLLPPPGHELQTGDDDDGLLLDVACSDDGAPFLEAWVSGSLASVFGISSPSCPLQPSPLFAQLLPPSSTHTSIDALPLLRVQVTYFECGGLCLGVQMHHMMCDGTSVAHFMQSWGEVARGGIEALKLPPYFERSRLLATQSHPSRTCNHHKLDYPEYQRSTENGACGCSSEGLRPQTVHNKIFTFTSSAIAELKHQILSIDSLAHDQCLQISRFEAVATHLWREVTRSRNLPPNQEVKLGFPVDARARLLPPLTPGFFGNAVFTGFAAMPTHDLLHMPLSYVARLVKQAITRVNNEYLTSVIDWLEAQPPKALISSMSISSFTYNCTHTSVCVPSWLRFPFYEVDFGWGKPSFVRIPSEQDEGIVYFFPSHPSRGAGSMEAMLSLQYEHMARIETHVATI